MAVASAVTCNGSMGALGSGAAEFVKVAADNQCAPPSPPHGPTLPDARNQGASVGSGLAGAKPASSTW